MLIPNRLWGPWFRSAEEHSPYLKQSLRRKTSLVLLTGPDTQAVRRSSNVPVGCSNPWHWSLRGLPKIALPGCHGDRRASIYSSVFSCLLLLLLLLLTTQGYWGGVLKHLWRVYCGWYSGFIFPSLGLSVLWISFSGLWSLTRNDEVCVLFCLGLYKVHLDRSVAQKSISLIFIQIVPLKT